MGEYVRSILDFLHFILDEGELYLNEQRVYELFDTLIKDENSCEFEREVKKLKNE